MVAPPPTVDKFASFANVAKSLRQGQIRCIWYLSDKSRCCLIEITAEDRELALQRIESVRKSYPTKGAPSVQDLADIAEYCCCGRHHRNKIWGSGLSLELASRWQKEILTFLAQALQSTAQSIKQEHVAVSVHSIALTPAPTRTSTHIYTPASTPVAFAKYQLLEWDTLRSLLLSDLDLRASKDGSIYFYTHAEAVFHGMVKIGYTSQNIESRLYDWAECGNGHPILLDSLRYVRHPERVEKLTHLELAQSRHALRWCKIHRKSHIEWFKVDCKQARTIAQHWGEWIEKAEPYDRRGRLLPSWVGHVAFLVKHDCLITAAAMAQIQRIEAGSTEVLEFIDDEVLRRSNGTWVKKEAGYSS